MAINSSDLYEELKKLITNLPKEDVRKMIITMEVGHAAIIEAEYFLHKNTDESEGNLLVTKKYQLIELEDD